MLTVIQFGVYFFALPIFCVLILIFNILLVRRAKPGSQRFRMLSGIGCGLLISLMLIAWDQSTDIFHTSSAFTPDLSRFDQILFFPPIGALIGFIFMLFLRALLRSRRFLFVWQTISLAMIIILTYFLITNSQIWGIVSITLLGFLISVSIYFMLSRSMLMLIMTGIPSPPIIIGGSISETKIGGGNIGISNTESALDARLPGDPTTEAPRPRKRKRK